MCKLTQNILHAKVDGVYLLIKRKNKEWSLLTEWGLYLYIKLAYASGGEYRN